jgi:cytoskeletal protein CcmA (bactofilin family)
MNKQFLFITVLLFCFINASGQSFPIGMKYQAVARDNSGNILAEQSINLKITLFSLGERDTKDISYVETHEATTNQLGLFSLTIGQGKMETGIFNEVPWSAGEIWMAVGIDAKGGVNFTSISESKLLAVPYAFHALTASDISGGTAGKFLAGEVWEIGGNFFKPDQQHSLGAIENVDIVLITNSIDRLRVLANGDVEIYNNVDIDGLTNTNSLDVEGNVHLNTLPNKTTIINGETTINNPLTVYGWVAIEDGLSVKSKAELNNDLTVMGDVTLNKNQTNSTIIRGATQIQNDLNVHQSVILNEFGGTTTIKGPASFEGATLFNSIDVQNEVVLNSVGSMTTIKGAAVLEGTLGVDGATTLNNTLEVNGVTNLNNTFNVTNAKVSNLNGNLNVDGATDLNSTLNVDGVTNLNNTFNVTNAKVSNLNGNLNVDGATDLNSTLNVDGVTNLNNTFNVTNAKVSNLNGNLNVDGATDLNNTLNVDGVTNLNNTFNVTNAKVSNLNGNLNVDGATDLNNTLNVDGVTNLNNTFNVTNAKVSNLNGNLNVDGATDLNNTLNVDGVTNLNNTFNVTNAKTSNLNGNLNVDGATDLNNTLNVDGATVLKSSLNVDGAIKINNISNLNGQVTVSTNVNGGDASYGAYPLRVQGSSQGIAIKLNELTPDNPNNFITFFNGYGNAIGRIEGEGVVSALTTPEYIYDNAFLVAESVVAGVAVGLAAIPVVVAGVGASAGPCGACIAIAAADLVLKLADITAYNVFVGENLGVTYQSGSADYAEWLERNDPNERITAGDIVGVNGGKISKYTRNAQQYMVISTKPAILGNMPMDGNDDLYEKVAFMGQIPVKVKGLVLSGDYILPSGLNDGTGIAVSPSKIKAEQYREIVGVAWSEIYVDGGISLVNMAIGLNANDVADLAVQQEKRIKDLENKFNSLEQRFLAMENGTVYSPSEEVAEAPSIVAPTSEKAMTRYEMITSSMPAELSNKVMEDAILSLENQYKMQGIKFENHPGLNKLFTDAAYKAEIIKKAQETYKKSYQFILVQAKNNN